jgi:hypothetical protein
MKVFIVMFGNCYEGYDCYSARWFLSYKEAEEYGDERMKERKFDFYEILEGEEGKQLN